MVIDDITRISHMLEEAQTAVSFCKGMTFEEFCNDRKTTNATVRSIEVIGEAASKISKPFQEKYIEINWQDVISMRNVLVHAYFEIDYEIVWKTVQGDLPPLIRSLKAILRKEKSANR